MQWRFTTVRFKTERRYVFAVLDLFSRRVAGLSMRGQMTADWVISAVNQVITHRQPGKGYNLHIETETVLWGTVMQLYEIGQSVAKRRAELGLTQAQLAKLARLSRFT